MEEDIIPQETQVVDAKNNEALENFKAMFYIFNAKRDTDIKVFNKNKLFKRDDILELNQKIQNKLHNHQIEGSIVSVTVSLNDNEIKTFGNWEEFKYHDWYYSSNTYSLLIEWDFNIIQPNVKPLIPQRHNIRVRIGSGLRPNEAFQMLMTGGEDFEIREAMSEMVLKIDFVNNQICAEIKALVTTWYEALDKNLPTNKLIELTQNHRGKIQLFITIICLMSAIIVLNIFCKSLLNNIATDSIKLVIKYNYLFVTSTIPFILVAIRIADFYSVRIIENTIFQYRKSPFIIITKGDVNKQKETVTENQRLIKELRNGVIIAVAVNLIVVFAGQYIPELVRWIIACYKS